MDYFTKWPEAYAIPNPEASTVVETLVTNFFCYFGLPLDYHESYTVTRFVTLSLA
jgi:hypothetical protein